MARKDIGTSWTRDTRNAMNDNFIELYNEYLGAGNNAADAKRLANEAVKTANAAKKEAESTQAQLDTIVVNGDSSVEAAAARVGTDGKTHATLKTRLDSENNDVNQQLAEKVKELKLQNVMRPFGEIKMPSDYPKPMPFRIYRDPDGTFRHTYNFNYHKGSTVLYVDFVNGDNSNDGSFDSPLKSVNIAIEKANALPHEVDIILKEKVASYAIFNYLNSFTLNNRTNIKSMHENGTFIFLGNLTNSMNWTQDGAVWKAPRNGVEEVVDYNYRENGEFKELLLAATLDECKFTPHSFYRDGSNVWIHTFDARKPDNDLAICLRIDAFVEFIASKTVYIEGLHFLYKQNTVAKSALRLKGEAGAKFVLNKCTGAFSNGNGIEIVDFSEALLFDCLGFKNDLDGANYHAPSIVANPKEHVIEFNCVWRDNGIAGKTTSNASSAHDGMTITRVNPIGYDCYGPLLADVNGCFSVVIDGRMFNSLMDKTSTKSAYWFDQAGAVKQGKAYLISCEGGGQDTYAINSDGLLDVVVQNGFVGNNIPYLSKITVE